VCAVAAGWAPSCGATTAVTAARLATCLPACLPARPRPSLRGHDRVMMGTCLPVLGYTPDQRLRGGWVMTMVIKSLCMQLPRHGDSIIVIGSGSRRPAARGHTPSLARPPTHSTPLNSRLLQGRTLCKESKESKEASAPNTAFRSSVASLSCCTTAASRPRARW
jgi:hypothetical protein